MRSPQRARRGKPADGGGIPDLRRMSTETHEAFLAIVLGGISQHDGLADLLSAEDAERIRQYVISRANLDQETSG